MISQKFDVVLPGHFAKDKDVVDGKEKNVLGSAVYYGAFPEGTQWPWRYLYLYLYSKALNLSTL